jgi:uncharacterized RDD family membrane protein YckC
VSTKLQFETPENVHIEYEPAGLGTRFLAWFVDQVLMVVVMIGAFIALACGGVSFDGLFESVEEGTSGEGGAALYYFMGLMTLIWGLGSIVYFGLSELLSHGQTIGKRMTKIRVVKADGFALDPGSVLVRNLFRVADHLSPLWIVPVLSSRNQRIGDMVAGTVVVADNPRSLSDVRTRLAETSAAEAEFRFDHARLKRLSSADIEAIERILDRWNELPPSQQAALLDRLVGPLVNKLEVESPPPERRLRFLEDLLSAEFRRQSRGLG